MGFWLREVARGIGWSPTHRCSVQHWKRGAPCQQVENPISARPTAHFVVLLPGSLFGERLSHMLKFTQ